MPNATRLQCPLPTCVWGVEELEEEQNEAGELEIAVEAGGRYMTPKHLTTIAQTQEDLKLHMTAHQITSQEASRPAASSQAQASKPAKLERPKLELDMNEAEWGLFTAEWARYCRSCKLTDAQEKVDQLWGCLSASLKRAAAGDGLERMADDGAFLARVKLLAVKKHNPLVAQVKFLSTGQDRDEPVHSFVARLRGIAAQCNFRVKSPCECGVSVPYDDRMIAHMLVRGLEDLGMQEKVLTLVAEKGEQSLQQLVTHIEAMETSKRSQGLMGTGQLSRMGTGAPKGGAQGGAKPGLAQAKCGGCGRNKSNHKGGKCFAHDLDCNNCGVKGHIGRMCKKPKQEAGQKKKGQANLVSGQRAEEVGSNAEEIGEVALLSPTKEGGFFFAGEIGMIGISHHIYSDGAWRPRKMLPHPTLGVRVAVDREAYGQLSLRAPTGHTRESDMSALVDTGAQMCILGREQVQQLGMRGHRPGAGKPGHQYSGWRPGQQPGDAVPPVHGPDPGWRHPEHQAAVLRLGGGGMPLPQSRGIKGLGSLPEGVPEGGGRVRDGGPAPAQ